ncbi:hypothetical protein BJV74DRAFT_866140, partial [Russula compacta]
MPSRWMMQNPQMDLQAQDGHTVSGRRSLCLSPGRSDKIMQRASEKRQLKALVIAKGLV